MRVLLTDSLEPTDRSKDYSNIKRSRYNFAFMCLSGYLKSHGFDVTVIDPVNHSREKYESLVREGNFDLAGISVWTSNVLQAYETARIVKELNPATPVVMGGVHATLFPELILEECEHADYVIAGEGEVALLALAESIAGASHDPAKSPSLTYRSNGSITSNPRAKPLTADELPFPDYEGTDIVSFRSHFPHFINHPTYQLSFSRGCPAKCTFCEATVVHGHRVKFKPVPKAIEEMAYLRDKHGARGFAFLDSTFTISPSWTFEFCEAYEREINLPWCCVTRSDRVNEKMIKAMKSSGCWKIGFGFESANEKTLLSINKGATVADNEEALRLCRRHGIMVYGSFILGWPGETYEDGMNTVNWALENTPNLCSFHLPYPFPGTVLRELAVKEGGMEDKYDWRMYDSLGTISKSVLYANPLIGAEGMARLQKIAYLKFYSSPKSIYYILKTIRTMDQFKGLLPHGLTYGRLLGSYLFGKK